MVQELSDAFQKETAESTAKSRSECQRLLAGIYFGNIFLLSMDNIFIH
jgi:hypothetical protein